MISSILKIFFPITCFTCSIQLREKEQYICTSCRHKLPVINVNLKNNNAVASIFYGRCKIEQAVSLLRFEKKGITQKLIHQLKYKGQQEIGVFLGEWLGEELAIHKGFSNIDMVIPVPLHKKKLRQRGYNQVDKFGRAIASALNCDYVSHLLVKETHTISQVGKERFSRWNNSKDLFKVPNANVFSSKHILLVDDIITTGATLEACIQEISSAKDVKISVATMAIA